MNQRFLVLDLNKPVSWQTYYQMRRGCTRVTIKKDIALGLAVEKGQPVILNLVQDLNKRPIVFFYADGIEWSGRSTDLDEWKESGGGSYGKRKPTEE